MAVIKLQSNFIEFPFQDNEGNTVMTLKFDKSDENIKKLETELKKIEKEQVKLEKKKEVSLDDAQGFLRPSIDSVFGDGSFDAMFNLSPSTIIVTDYFIQMAEGIFEEINSDKQQEKLNKYLQ